MSIIKSGYTFSDSNEDWASRKATAIRLNKLIDDAVWNGALNSDGYAPDDGITPNDPTSLSYTSGVESINLSWSWTQNTAPLKTWIYESTTTTLPTIPSFYVGQDQRKFFRENLTAGSTRYYWIKVEARNGRFSNVVGPIAATVTSWPVTDTITTNLAKKITRSATSPASPNDGDIWINTTDNNILYRWNSSLSTWQPYPDKRVDSLADEYVLMVTPTGAGPSQRIMGFRATNSDSGKIISVATRSLNVITITTSTAHGYVNNDLVSITGLTYSTSNPNGAYLITSTGTTTFTYIIPSGSGTETYGVTGAYAAKGTEFVIQADKFAIIDSTGVGQVAPFQVIGGTTYIKDALIKDLSATKITSGTITSGNISVNGGYIQSSGFSAGTSGWQIKGNGDAEFNSVTVRNGTITSPTMTSATFTNALVINSTLGVRRSVDDAVLTITGASNNGSAYGAQIDLVGNDYPTTSAGGWLILQAGQGAASEIRMHTNASPIANVGVERLVIETDGLVNVRRRQSVGPVYTTDAGNLLVEGNIGVGTSTPINTNTSRGNISASGAITASGALIGSSVSTSGNITSSSEIWTSGAGATRVGFLNAAGSTSGTTFVGLQYNATDNVAELAALSGGVAWRDVHIAPNAKAMFGTYTADNTVTIDGYIEIKDSSGTVRKLAVVS